MFAIIAHVSRVTDDGWTSTRSLPTFYLHPSVQGLRDADHAAGIAHRILDPFDDLGVDLSVTAVEVDL